MDLVIDANIVIAALISPTGHTADLFFSPLLRVFAPELLLEEINKHKQELLQKTGLSEHDFAKAVALLSPQITFSPVMEFVSFLPRARKISPDPDDAAYIALALRLECPLWSNDKQLKLQTEVKVCSTSELLRFFS